jgi:hypothetical protein
VADAYSGHFDEEFASLEAGGTWTGSRRQFNPGSVSAAGVWATIACVDSMVGEGFCRAGEVAKTGI